MADPPPQRDVLSPIRPQGMQMAAGFDVIVSSVGAMLQEVQRTTRDMVVNAERTATFLADSESKVERIAEIQERALQAQTEMIDRLNASVQSVATRTEAEVTMRGAPEAPAGPSRAAADPHQVSPASSGGVETTADMLRRRNIMRDSMGPVSQPINERNIELWQRGRGYSVAALRKDVSRSVLRRINDWSGPMVAQSDRGVVYDPNEEGPFGTLTPTDMELPPMSQWDDLARDEETGQWFHPSDPERTFDLGEQGIAGVEGVEQVQERMRSQRSREIARNAIGGLAQGKPVSKAILGAIPTGAARVAGGVAAVGAIARQGIRFAEGQRQQNLQFQRALGGTNVEGFEERARRQMFGWSQMGQMGGEQARQLYDASMRLFGTDQDRRGEAQEFGRDSFMEFGMSVQQSMQMVEQATRMGVDSFDSLSGSLRRVTEDARDAGVNAESMRESFARNLGMVSGFARGEGALVQAEALTRTQIGLGRELNLAGVEFGGLGDQRVLRMIADARGERFGETMLDAQTDIGAAEVAGGLGDLVMQDVRAAMGPAAMQMIQERVAEERAARGEEIGSNDRFWSDLATEVFSAFPQVDPFVVQQILADRSRTNVPLPQVPEFVARFAGGGVDMGETAMEAATQWHARALTPEERGGLDVEEDPTWITPPGDPASARAFRDAQGREGLESTYRDIQRETNQVLPVVEAFLENREARQGAKFAVQTAAGEEVVDFETALRHHWDQLQSGDVEIVSGQHAGRMVRDVFGGQSDIGITSDVDPGAAGHGVPAEEFAREQAGQGRIVLEASPQLRQWIEIQTYGNVDYYGRQGVQAPPATHPGEVPGGR